MLLLLVVYCLSCSLTHEHLKGMNQAVFIFVFLAPRAVPGPGRCHISALCLQSSLMTVILFIPPAQRALFQPEKETCFHPSLALRGLLA